jgi:hypothetical protein
MPEIRKLLGPLCRRPGRQQGYGLQPHRHTAGDQHASRTIGQHRSAIPLIEVPAGTAAVVVLDRVGFRPQARDEVPAVRPASRGRRPRPAGRHDTHPGEPGIVQPAHDAGQGAVRR